MSVIRYYWLWSYMDNYISNKKEFCFDEFSYMWVENGYIFSKNYLINFSYEEEKRRKEGKSLIIYYKERWYESDIIWAYRMWLVKEKLKKQLEWFMKDKWLARSVEYKPRSYRIEWYIEFLPVILFPMKYRYKWDEIKKILSEKRKDKEVIEWYYIMNVLNRVSNKEELRKISEIIKKKKDFKWNDFIMLTFMWRYIIFSERIKAILEKADLGVYNIIEFYTNVW